MTIDIPGYGQLTINTLILDLNGTLTVGGLIVPGVEERIKKLKELGYRLVMLSVDTRGNAREIADRTGIELIHVENYQDKQTETEKLDPETCAGIGNGQMDLLKMKVVKLGIVTLQAEGVFVPTLLEADIVVPSINDALDLFIDTNRLKSTLRR